MRASHLDRSGLPSRLGGSVTSRSPIAPHARASCRALRRSCLGLGGDIRMRTWWQAWGELVRKLVAFSASFASLVALLLAFIPPPRDLPWWAIALVASAVFFFVVLVALEVVSYRRQRVYAMRDTEGIKRYMHDWIEHGGRVAVWTRDMSWARNKETRRLLEQKAKRDELILCLPKRDEFTNTLEAAGAEVCAYGADLLEAPASRFTITFYGRDGARVAVGRADGDSHVIREFSSASHPAFCLAEDLVELVRAQCASGHRHE